MSRFSHRQTVWTFGPVVLLSTLLLSPVTASIVLRALLQAMPHDGLQATVRLVERTTPQNGSPLRQESSEAERLGQPRRTEEEVSGDQEMEGERYVPQPENEPDVRNTAYVRTDVLSDIALCLPTRIVLTVPDDIRLTLLPSTVRLTERRDGQSSTPPRAPPV